MICHSTIFSYDAVHVLAQTTVASAWLHLIYISFSSCRGRVIWYFIQNQVCFYSISSVQLEKGFIIHKCHFTVKVWILEAPSTYLAHVPFLLRLTNKVFLFLVKMFLTITLSRTQSQSTRSWICLNESCSELFLRNRLWWSLYPIMQTWHSEYFWNEQHIFVSNCFFFSFSPCFASKKTAWKEEKYCFILPHPHGLMFSSLAKLHPAYTTMTDAWNIFPVAVVFLSSPLAELYLGWFCFLSRPQRCQNVAMKHWCWITVSLHGN